MQIKQLAIIASVLPAVLASVIPRVGNGQNGAGLGANLQPGASLGGQSGGSGGLNSGFGVSLGGQRAGRWTGRRRFWGETRSVLGPTILDIPQPSAVPSSRASTSRHVQWLLALGKVQHPRVTGACKPCFFFTFGISAAKAENPTTLVTCFHVVSVTGCLAHSITPARLDIGIVNSSDSVLLLAALSRFYSQFHQAPLGQ
ncbi:hypothetical protein PM082_006695 [Marasmius tenuissimus]|nr:hypothetical protein PM082_006695 [Marasmius tenuissimus]